MTVATRKAILAASFSFLLAACGGGGSGGNGGGVGPDPNNLPPVVDAGPNRQLESNQTVTLTGTATDPDGSVEQVQWTQISGTPVVQLTNANTLSASFAAPAVNNSTTLVFQLSATDTDNASSTDTVSITLIPPGSSVAPVIEEPIAPKRANQGETVTLTATATDPDGSIARYDWAFLDATPSITPAVNIVISGDNDATPEATFVAPAVQQPTVLRFLLTVTDDSSTQNTDTAEAFVTVYPLPQPARAAQLYVTDGAGLISRFESQANTPTEFTTDIPEFGRFDPGAGTRTINGPLALTVDGRLVQTDEEDPNGIQEVCAFPRRGNDDQFGTVRDRRINFDLFGSDGTGAADGRIENYAGVAIAHGKGYLITIDTYSGSGSQDARAIHVYGSAVTGNRPYDNATGNRQLVADIPLGANGNDLLYDEQGDRLFVTLKSGRIAAFENFLTEIEAVRAERGDTVAIGEEIEVDALIEINGVVTSPAEPHDFRGIAYHRESDRLIVSDIGLPGASGSDDGAIYILSNATDAVRRGFGATVDADAVIIGRAGDAPLGDPTDISLNGRDLVVADQANNRIYVYADIFGAISQYDGVTPLAPAPADDPLVVAGATHIVVQPLDTPFRPHVNDLGPDMDGLELASVLAYRTVTVEGAVQQQLLRLAPNLGGSAAIPNLSYALPADYTAAGMGLAVNGDVYTLINTPFVEDGPLAPLVGAGSDGISSTQVIGSAAKNRLLPAGASLSVLRERGFNLQGAQSARGALVIDEFGVIVVPNAEGRGVGPGLSIHTVCGNGLRLGELVPTQRFVEGQTINLRPTDVDYDGRNGDLYISLIETTDNGTVGKLGIFRAFDRYLEALIADPGTPITPNPLLVVTPRVVGTDGATFVPAAGDYQAIEYLPVLDQLVLASAAASTETFNDGDPSRFDGRLVIVGRTAGFGASQLFGGNVDQVVTVAGPATKLGDPSDLAFDGFNLYVAEKGEGLVLKLDDIESTPGGNVAPTAERVLTGVEAIVPVPAYVSGRPDERLPLTP